MPEQTVFELRVAAKKQLADWYHQSVVSPFIKDCKAAGLSDDETNALYNEIARDMFSGLFYGPMK